MRQILFGTASTLLLGILCAIFWIGYSYASISAEDDEILGCEKSRVGPVELPPEPVSQKVRIGTKPEEVCTKVPKFKGLNISWVRKCTVVRETPVYEEQAPTEDAFNLWKAEVADRTESWKQALEAEATRCAEEARDNMKEEIAYWSTVIAGPAPYLIGLVGFVVGLVASRKRDAQRNI